MKVIGTVVCFLVFSFSDALRADNARFDLVGPKIEVRVTRASTTLPIAQVPNLRPGDRLWVKADLPANQANHLLLIIAFLRGTTNEPPDGWFTEIDTWEKKTREGTTVVVPQDAEEAVMFVAPETGGDFKTLRSAVKGKPGLFIRANADLNEASFEQQRIEHYLAAMKTVPQNDQKTIEDRSGKLAATLALKPNADCFKQAVDQQVSCLTQSSAPVLLDDGHGQSIASAISTGPSSDFINAASVTPMAGAGVYSAYVGAVVDLVHMVSLMRTAQYQYIPAIAFPESETLNLKLNAPPSFVNPKSVIVIGLPAIQEAKLPPLRPHDANQVSCLLQPKMTLLLEGAPLVFSTSFAHDLVLRLNRTGAPTDIPLRPDAFEGGLIVAKEETRRQLDESKETSAEGAKKDVKMANSTDLLVTGTVHGYWGFDAFEGPTLTLQQVPGKGWKVVGDTQLMAGEDNHLTLTGDGTGCVEKVALTNKNGKDLDVSFKPAAGDDKAAKEGKGSLDLAVSMKKVQPGDYALAIKQYGDTDVSKVSLTAYTSDIHLDALKVHRGDSMAVLSGQGLANVASVELAGQTFSPQESGGDGKTLELKAREGVSPESGTEATAKLKDGRTMKVKVMAGAARPRLNLVSMNATPAQQSGALPVVLGAKSDIPLNGKLTFVVQTKEVFPRTQSIEVAAADGSVKTMVSLAGDNLVLQDQHTAIATLEPVKVFGQSAFGKLQMRPVAQDGTTGDWTDLGTLVRTPQITAIKCTTADAATCVVDGSSLFLVQTFGADKDFAKPAEVPSGFADGTFAVPTPADGATLYMKLRDDPANVASVVLPLPVQKAAPAALPDPTAEGGTQSTPAPPADATPTAPPAAPLQPATQPQSVPNQ
jgi:hypothetical protein